MLIFKHDAAVCAWVAGRLPHVRKFGPEAKAIGIVRGGHLVAGIVYDNYSEWLGNIEMGVASSHPRWLSREVLRAAFAFPFDQLGCHRVTLMVRKKDKHTRRFVERLGFRLEGTHKGWFARSGHGDGVSYGLLKRQWKEGRYA